MRILFPEDVAEADRLTCEGQGISSMELMERAVTALSEAIRRRFPLKDRRILVVCGPGNNGGDGLALARQLSSDSSVTVFLPDCMLTPGTGHLHMLHLLPPAVKQIKAEPAGLAPLLPETDLLIDGLFGAGLNRPLESCFAELINLMNQASCPAISIDVPSGLLFPVPENPCILQADHVFSFHSPKPAFLAPESEKFVGDFSVLDIGLILPPEKTGDYHYSEIHEIRQRLQKESRFSHKGSFGHGLILAGSSGKTGAAVLAAGGFLRSGAGLLSIQVPSCSRDVLQISCPEAMVISDKQEEYLSSLPDISPFKAIGIGPGIGMHPLTRNLLQECLHSRKPMVLDADALNLLAANPELMKIIPAGSILSPHPGEFSRLCGEKPSGLQAWQAARDFSSQHQVYLILKGAFSLVCSPDGRAWFNSTGNPGMAKGGSGDVLTGLLTGLLTRGYSPEDSCLIGVFLHGMAGDLAADSTSSTAMKAGDLIEFLPAAWKQLRA